MAEVFDIVMKSGITEEVTSAFHGIMVSLRSRPR
jgi:hypothetical protein